jgi:hypothetical protein
MILVLWIQIDLDMSSSAVEKEEIQNTCISDSDQSFAKDEKMMNNWHLQSLP